MTSEKKKEPNPIGDLDGWCKFPYTRPLEKAVVVFIDGQEKNGVGVRTPRIPLEGYTGMAIETEGTVFDSNHAIWWKYLVNT